MPSTFVGTARLGLAFGVALTVQGGCKTPEPARDSPLVHTQGFLQQDGEVLQGELAQFMEFAESEITSAADRIEAHSENRAVRRAALLWKIEIVPEFRETHDAEDPRALLVDNWALCVRMSRYLKHGDGKALFGGQQATAVDAARRVQERIESVAREHLPEQSLSTLRPQIETYAREHPIRGVFVHEEAEELSDRRSVWSVVAGAPFWAAGKLRKALDPTQRLSLAVDRFIDLMEDYPSLVRWETQLLLLQIEESSATRSTLESLGKVSDSSVRLATTAEHLPQNLGEEARTLLDGIEAQQPELRETLREAQQTLILMNEVLAKAENVSATVERSIREASTSGEVWQRTVAEVAQTLKQVQQGGRPDDRPGAEPPLPAEGPAVGDRVAGAQSTSKPFDIDEYRLAMEAMTATAQELRGLLIETRAFLDGETPGEDQSPLGAVSAEVLGQTGDAAREIVDHATWRAAQILAALFVLGVVYCVVVQRYSGNRGR